MTECVLGKPKILTLDDSTAIPVSKDKHWHLKPGEKLEVKWSSQYEKIIEFEIPELGIESYADCRNGKETLEHALLSRLAIEIQTYALESDGSKLAANAFELKNKLLAKFEPL